MLVVVPRTVSRLVALTLSLGLLSATAAASPLDGKLRQDGLGIEVGAIMQGGRSEYASNNLGLNPTAQGLILRDRNGMSSRMVIGLLIALAGAAAQSGPKSVESKSHVSGDYIITETTTTYYSEAEKAQMREATSKSIDGVFSTKYSDMELQLYSRDRFGFGDASGYKINFMIGAGDSIAFEGGFGFGKVESMVDVAGVPTKLTYKYLGMPFRLSKAAGPVRVGLTYEWNWLKYGIADSDRQLHMDDKMNQVADVTSHPWHLDLSTVAFKRVSLMVGATAQEIKKPTKLGYFLQAGVMF